MINISTDKGFELQSSSKEKSSSPKRVYAGCRKAKLIIRRVRSVAFAVFSFSGYFAILIEWVCNI